MPKTLALLHTAPVTIPLFTGLIKERIPDIEIFHMLDESLIKNTLKAGRLEPATLRRIVVMTESAAEAGADAVMVVCSSIGPGVDAARPLVDIPVIRVDEAMADEAVRAGARIGVVATLSSTLKPTVELIEARAALQGETRTITQRLCEGAFDAVVSGDAETHDRLVVAELERLAGEVDVIVLAQASMARAADAIPQEQRRVPILSSPALGVENARKVMASL